MSTTTQAARYSADYIDLGSDDEACARCEGDGCSHCHGRGLVPATSAPTDEHLRAMTQAELGGPWGYSASADLDGALCARCSRLARVAS